ncbi:unnamed protein product [Rhizoctonia solani]|uniref:Transmembrane protein n=1 Tax=Rhizoctonia solani TaxID=456999 RepID=A0A8H2XMF1_9AGAM|nr:unnamed protein product [Rhizoctonia solani]
MPTKLPSEPTAAMLNLSALAYLLGVTVITWCITRATEKYSLYTRKAWSNIPWARLCLMLVLFDAWLYLIITGVLLHGAPREHSPHMCSIGILLCLICFDTSKALVYLCLIERVRAVWNTKRPRWRSPVYLFCVALLIPLAGMVAGEMIPHAIHYIYNGYCVLGVTRLSSVFFLAYDICINLFLTGMFVVPLMRSTIRSAWLRTVAIRSTVASVIALVSTTANGAIIFATHGNEAIWVCLGACATDLVINAVVLYWALQVPGESSDSRAKAVYFSPIGGIPTFQPSTMESISTSQGRSMVSNFSDRDNASDATVAVPHVPSLEKPKPTMQNPRHQVVFVQPPSRKRYSLPIIAERTLSFRAKPESQSQGRDGPDSL